MLTVKCLTIRVTEQSGTFRTQPKNDKLTRSPPKNLLDWDLPAFPPTSIDRDLRIRNPSVRVAEG